MITKPTVLVLGAGASYPYNFPLGKDLLDRIVDDTSKPSSALFQILGRCHIPDYHIKQLGTELRASSRPSIDAFLESRGDLITVGRLAIAAALLGCEDKDKIHKTNDWYQYLFNSMSVPHQFESFSKSNLSIVTFNYDRSLEFCLFTALRKSFQKSHGECVEQFRYIPIIHVHGQVGTSPTEENGWPYGSPFTLQAISLYAEKIKSFAEQIKIIHEAEGSPEFLAAQALINNAEVICFLGFGYHTTNLARLFKGLDNLGDKEMLCCGYGLTEREKNTIKMRIPSTKQRWGDKSHGCYEFLREEGVLLS